MAQIVIEGTAYELPETFTLKEMRIIERYCKGDFNNQFAATVGGIHVAIARAKPDVSFEEIEELLDGLDVTILKQIEAGQSPPAESKSEQPASSSDASEPPSAAIPENGNHESSGSPDLAGFQSFHSKSEI